MANDGLVTEEAFDGQVTVGRQPKAPRG